MDIFMKYLKENLDLKDYNFLKTKKDNYLMFKTNFKYTKCIYIKKEENLTHINIDKVYDEKYSKGIERLMISSVYLDKNEEILNYIQKNILV